MASKPIQPLVLDSIGIYGLNRQSSAASLPPQFLTTANNIMLDEKGRVTTREGIKQITNNVHTGSLDTDGNPTTTTVTRTRTEMQEQDVEETITKTVPDLSSAEDVDVFEFGYGHLKTKLEGLFGADNVVDC